MIALGVVLALTLGPATLLVLGQSVLRRIYSYALTPARFEVRLFGRVPIYAVSLRDVTDVALRRFTIANLAATFTTLSFGNRIFGRAIVIERRRKFPRYIVVTPDDPDRMLADIDTHISAPLTESA